MPSRAMTKYPERYFYYLMQTGDLGAYKKPLSILPFENLSKFPENVSAQEVAKSGIQTAV